MKPDKHNHGVGRPAMHVAHEHAEGHVELQILHVGVSILGDRPVVEHEINASHHGNQEHQESQPAHTPGKTHAHGVASHLGRVEMQKNVGRYHHDAVSRRVFITVAKNRLPNVAFDDIAFDLI